MNIIHTFAARAVALLPRAAVRPLSRRYIAGDTLTEAVARIRDLNRIGCAATIDFLGEAAASVTQAEATTAEYVRVLDAIAAGGLRANISVKPTALGLLLDEAHCERLFRQLAVAAARHGNFVRMDMEDTRCTQLELDLFERLRPDHANVGIVLQSYLKRTDEDLGSVLQHGASLRLCKGIYVEARDHLVEGAWRDRRAINAHMLRHFARSLDAGVRVALATHDEEVIDAALAIAQAKRASNFEFQMLLGVCEPLRDRLLRAGHAVRIYVPYGADWHGYSVRRLKESPQIAGHLLRAMFRRGR